MKWSRPTLLSLKSDKYRPFRPYLTDIWYAFSVLLLTALQQEINEISCNSAIRRTV